MITDNEMLYINAMAWWHRKTPEQKFAFLGIEALDKWVEGIVRKQYLEQASELVWAKSQNFF